MNVLQMSVSASVFIVAVVIIRALALYKLPKKTFLFLWGAVICRLLIPFSIRSRFSFYSGLDKLRRIFLQVEALTFSAKTADNTDFGTGYPVGISTTSSEMLPVVIIWIAGMCACAIFFLAVYIKCRREFQTSVPVENDFTVLWLKEHQHQIHRTVCIRQCNKIKSPLTYGAFQPVILLPKVTDWADETNLRYILTHEYVHIRRFDTLSKILLAFVLCVHWFNPFVWVMYVLANRDIELSCDETVVRTLGESTKSAYAMTLICMEEMKSKLSPLCNNFSKNAIEERIVSIMKIKKTSLMGIIMTLMLVVSTTTAFTTNTAAAMPAEATIKYIKLNSQVQNVDSSDSSFKDLFTVDVAATPANATSTYSKVKKVKNNKDLNVVSAPNPTSKDLFTISYPAEIPLKNGQVVDLGTYPTMEERNAAIKAYCDKQVKSGSMTQQEANDILN